MALAKARLAVLAKEVELAPGAADRIATLVRARPWPGVGVALGLGLALGLSRGRGVQALGTVVGPLGAALATGFMRRLGASSPASALEAKIAEVRSRQGTG
ncbi:MAG: hypothetical protein ABR510_10870 [Trueperaceae bacterium]